MLAPMRYKDYVWPHNPKVYSIRYERNMAVHKTPFGLFQLQDLGRTFRTMEGSGEFVGDDAYRQFGQLANRFYHGGPGLLVHPLWQAANAYFVSLRLEQEPQPDYVRYSFTFWEDDSWYSGLAVREVPQNPSQTASGTSQDSQNVPENVPAPSPAADAAYHLVTKGDTLWALAQTYGLSLPELIALNPQIKNPNLIRVGEKVRVK